MTENRKTPKLRFKGFTDAWEHRKLGEVGKCQSGIGFPDAEQGGKIGTPFYKVSDMNNYGNEQEMTYANNYVTDEQITRKNWKPIMEVPAVIFAKVGAAIMLNRKRLCRFPFLLDNNTMTYKFGEKWDTNFGKTLFEKIDLTELIQIGALPSYNATDVENIDIKMPADIYEQKVIGQYFANIDNLITLHQRKLDRLKNIKKSMLDKMFPKDGEVVPEIRFKGFTDAWEQRKLGNVGTITSGFMGDSLLSDGKYHLTRIETIADGTVDENRIGYSVRKPDDIYLLKYGDILYSNINSISHMGKVAKYQGKTPLYHGINLLRLEPIQTINSDFMLYLLNTDKCRNWAKTRANQAVSQASINQSLLATQEIKICSTNEQQKIGQYFSRLDNLITLHQRKLDKLKNIKKSMLDNMFV